MYSSGEFSWIKYFSKSNPLASIRTNRIFNLELLCSNILDFNELVYLLYMYYIFSLLSPFQRNVNHFIVFYG